MKGRDFIGRVSSVPSSSTLCKRVFTCPLKRASPEPGVFLILLFFLLHMNPEGGVCIARPTIGESLVMSISADLSSCALLFFL